MIRQQTLIVFIFVCLSLCGAFRTGERVISSRRLSIDGVVTPWAALLGKDAPKFGKNEIVSINLNFEEKIAKELKVAFSFGEDRFLLPWVTLQKGSKSFYPNYAEIIFIHSGDDIIEVKVKILTEQLANHPLSSSEVFTKNILYLKYKWVERGEKDMTSGLAVLFLVGFVLALIVFFSIIFGDVESSLESGTEELPQSIQGPRGVPVSHVPLSPPIRSSPFPTDTRKTD
eukprot:TRINITY_DN7079_c0_g1_i1.p1 TRINITY_DN7079_c0_g1~~TRINITY_DN7079_c0_g1_i1.p1  ORF type:complete len:229 (-),score=45.99 TRINITY_DN7079_c0_g1_i1:53-739(-)